MTYRQSASHVLRKFNRDYGLVRTERFLLKDVDAMSTIFRSKPRNSERQMRDRFADEIALCSIGMGSIAMLSLVAAQSKHKRIVLKSDFPAHDSHLCSFLTNISNSAQAALRLVVDGFDTQARALVRTLDERMYQAIVLFSSADDFKAWHEAESAQDAKSSWYKLFSRRSRLKRKLRLIENNFFRSQSDLDQLQAWRKEQDEFYSMAVHGSMAAVLIGSWAFSLGEDDGVTFPNLFGMASGASGRTLNHLLFQLHHFNFLFPSVLKSAHGWESGVDDELERAFLALNTLTLEVVGPWIQNELVDA